MTCTRDIFRWKENGPDESLDLDKDMKSAKIDKYESKCKIDFL